MAALDPAVAAVRAALRALPRPDPDALVLVACSGGPDSMALAAGAAFVFPRLGLRVGLVTVDHQLQPGSAAQAAVVRHWAAEVGLAPVLVSTVVVSGRTGGPEAAARDARYEALAAAGREHHAHAVLLGHTRDDQAETVLMSMLRGAGTRGLAGMPARGRKHGVLFVRPLLDVARAQTTAACRAEALPVWQDPHNSDPAYRRTHARRLLASLADELGPAVVGNLARTARLAAADAVVLDRLAVRAGRRAAAGSGSTADALSVVELSRLPSAIRGRVLHRWAKSLGAPGGDLSHRHVDALDALVMAWRGQGAVSLPGGAMVVRRDGRLVRADKIHQPTGPDIPRAAPPSLTDEAGLRHG